MILCWAAFMDILGHMGPVGHRLDTPEALNYSGAVHHTPQFNI